MMDSFHPCLYEKDKNKYSFCQFRSWECWALHTLFQIQESPALIRPPQMQLKTGLIGGMVSLKEGKLVVLHYLSASKFWPFVGVAYKRQTTMFISEELVSIKHFFLPEFMINILSWSFTSCNHSDGLFCVVVIHIHITLVITSTYKERKKTYYQY